MSEHRRRISRWQRSPLTFGPLGRLLASLVVLAPLGLAVLNVFFLLAGLLWLFILPRVLRDIWRPARVHGAELPPAPQTTSTILANAESIGDRSVARRW
jgi:hypothetical protein